MKNFSIQRDAVDLLRQRGDLVDDTGDVGDRVLKRVRRGEVDARNGGETERIARAARFEHRAPARHGALALGGNVERRLR